MVHAMSALPVVSPLFGRFTLEALPLHEPIVLATFDQQKIQVFRHASTGLNGAVGQWLVDIPSSYAIAFLATGPGQLLYAATKEGVVFRIATD